MASPSLRYFRRRYSYFIFIFLYINEKGAAAVVISTIFVAGKDKSVRCWPQLFIATEPFLIAIVHCENRILLFFFGRYAGREVY